MKCVCERVSYSEDKMPFVVIKSVSTAFCFHSMRSSQLVCHLWTADKATRKGVPVLMVCWNELDKKTKCQPSQMGWASVLHVGLRSRDLIQVKRLKAEQMRMCVNKLKGRLWGKRRFLQGESKDEKGRSWVELSFQCWMAEREREMEGEWEHFMTC